MKEKELRWKIGNRVKVELVEATNPSCCRFGHKVGDSWDVSVWECAGLCGLAYYNFFPFISMYQCGGEAPWKKGGEGDLSRDQVTRTCPDLRAGFKFVIRKMEKYPPPSEYY